MNCAIYVIKVVCTIKYKIALAKFLQNQCIYQLRYEHNIKSNLVVFFNVADNNF